MSFKNLSPGKYLVKTEAELWAAATHFYRQQTKKRPGKDFAASIYTIALHGETMLEDGKYDCSPSIVGFSLSDRPGFDVDQVFHFCLEDVEAMADLLRK